MPIVEFQRGHTPYRAGERACFDAKQAEFLRSRGIVSIIPAQPSLSSLRDVTVTRPLRRAVTKDNPERS
ncbi:MAG: hypothetical protein FJX60_22440 [Alphaproteobacteria bacterium]|nr:hypothetical protein [Alphaproteobacteria bacterium]